jgi:aryl-alcohol dehydrogenase-like predicted oxidoreductase
MRDEVLTAVQQLLPIAADLGLTPAQLAIAWVLSRPNVSAAIVGASRPEQVADNVKAAGVRLTPEVLAAIDAVVGSVVISDPARTESPAQRP